LPFLTRLAVAEPFETWTGMERAAAQRFWDALVLATGEAGHEAGAIYLFGYVAEMLLKTAYFRFIGVPVGQDIAPVLRAVRNHSLWTGRNLHDLRSWIDFLIDIRQLQGQPLSPLTAGAIRQRVLAVDAHWRESLRYTPQAATVIELDETFAGVEWLRDNHALLWR
jgi:hypothetical protein